MTKEEKALYDREYRTKNKELLKVKKANYYKVNKENIRKTHKIKYDNNPEYYRERTKNFKVPKEKKHTYNKKFKLKKNYNLSIEEYNFMLVKQNYSCKICNKDFMDKIIPYVDHCHKTGKVRGLLCITCNTGLGMANDDIRILNNMINYLKEC